MARTNNLNDFLTDVADSIRAKTGKTDKISAASFDTEIEGITAGEDLSEELNAYNTSLTTQETSIQDIIKALDGKAAAGDGGGDSGSGEVVSADYITDGLIDWFDAEDEFDSQGHWNSRVAESTHYIYSVGTTNATNPVLNPIPKGKYGYASNCVYPLAITRDCMKKGYTIEVVGKVRTQGTNNNYTTTSGGAWLLTLNMAKSIGIGIYGDNNEISFLNIKTQQTGYYPNFKDKYFGATLYIEEIFDRTGYTSGGMTTDNPPLKAYGSAHGEPLRVIRETTDNTEFKAPKTPILCYYAQDTNYCVNGEICCVRIYDRKLTSEEIAFNHAIDKARFKLEN